jgi:Ice-binding-like
LQKKVFSALLLLASYSLAESNVPLGAAGTFAVLGSSTVTNTGTSVIKGNVGVSPGSAVTGFPPGIVTAPSAIYAADPTSVAAHAALASAYNAALAEGPGQNLSGTNLGGLTLTPGVYTFDTSAMLTGTLTLSGAGYYIFRIGTTLGTASGSIVAAIQGADAATIFWQVGSSATLGTSSVFIGNILAYTSITTTTGVLMAGRLLALNGAVTMDTLTLTYPPATTPGGFGGPPVTPPPPPGTPAPSSWMLVLIGLACAMLFKTRERFLRWKNR